MHWAMHLQFILMSEKFLQNRHLNKYRRIDLPFARFQTIFELYALFKYIWLSILVNNLRWQMSVWRQSNISLTLNWRWTDVRLTSANVNCLLGY